MKKYTKPMIVFESFTLSTHIASDCEVKTNTPNNNDGCGIEMGRNQTVFILGMTGCKTIEITPNSDGDGFYDSFCYHVFDGKKNLFNS